MEEIQINMNTLYMFMGISFVVGFMMGKKFVGMIFKFIMIVVFVVAAYFYFKTAGSAPGQ